MRLLPLALLFPFFLQGQPPGASPFTIYSPIDSFLILSPFQSVFADRSRQTDLPGAIAHWEHGDFIPLEKIVWPPYFTRGKFAYWVRIAVKNETGNTLEATLYQTSGDSITLYEKGIQTRYCGTVFCRDSLQGPAFFPLKRAFPLRWMPGEIKELYLRVCSHPNFNADLDLFLANPAWYNRLQYIQKAPQFLVSGGLLGFIGFLFLFSFSQWVETRDKAYFYYNSYLSGLLLLQLRSLGVLIWDSNNPFYWKAYFSYILMVCLLYGAYILFLDAVSDARQTAPFLHRFFRVTFVSVISLFSLASAVYWIDPYVGWYITLSTKVLCQVAGLSILVVFWRQSNLIFRYLAWGMGCLVIFGFASIASEFTPYAHVINKIGLSTDVIAYPGVILELLFFTLGLAYKTRMGIREKEQVKAENQRLVLEKALETERLRTHIAQDIHDEVGGRLTRMALASELALRVPNLSPEELKSRLAELGAGARAASGNLREVVFSINPAFDRFSEMQAYMRESAREFFKDTEMEVVFDFPKAEQDPVLSPHFKRQLLFLYKEALQNIMKHAEASTVWIRFQFTAPGRFKLEVRDDGKGFDLAGTPMNGFHHGLNGMKKRAESMHAELTVRTQLGEGVLIGVEGAV